MTETERIDILVDRLAGGNAARFARSCDIRPDSLCKIRKGQGNPRSYFPRILSAHPEVRREFLEEGKGYPLTTDKASIESRLDDIEKRLSALEKLGDKIFGFLSDLSENTSEKSDKVGDKKSLRTNNLKPKTAKNQ